MKNHQFFVRAIGMLSRRVLTNGIGTLIVLGALGATRLQAQPVVINLPPGPPRTAPTTATVTIGGIFGTSPATPVLTQNSQTGNLCSPGACFVGAVVARGNRGWKLQVRLASTPVGFSVRYVQTTTPPNAQAVNSGTQTLLTTTTWLTIATGATATSGSSIGVMFNANKNPGNQGVVPNATQVAAVVMYQVVANP